MGELKETLKVEYYFDASGSLKVKGVESPKELPLCYGWKKRLRRSKNDCSPL